MNADELEKLTIKEKIGCYLFLLLLNQLFVNKLEVIR